jgi:hypothetical protein
MYTRQKVSMYKGALRHRNSDRKFMSDGPQPRTLFTASVVKAALDERQSESSGLDFCREFDCRSKLVQPWNAQESLDSGDPAGLQVDLLLGVQRVDGDIRRPGSRK